VGLLRKKESILERISNKIKILIFNINIYVNINIYIL